MRRRVILLAIEQPAMRAALLADLSRLRWGCVSAPTFQAIVQRLEDPALRVVAAIIDARHPAATAILGYLADEHASVRRVMLADPRSDEPFANAGVQALLVTSWQRSALVAAVGVVGR